MSFFEENIQGELLGIQQAGGAKAMSRGSRREIIHQFQTLNPNIRAELRNAKLRLGDYMVYSVKPVGASKTIKMFESQDQKEIGLRNVSNAKLPKNQALMVSGIMVLAGVAPAAVAGSPTTDEIKATPFGTIDHANYAGIINGEVSFTANKRTILPETSCRIFASDNNSNVPVGFYKLDNPRVWNDNEEAEFVFELATTTNIPTDTYLYVALYGTITHP